MARSIILLLDSFGIGYAHDAEKFGDSGADTLGHICEWMAANRKSADGSPRYLHLPNLARLGLAGAAELSRGQKLAYPLSSDDSKIDAAYTYAEEIKTPQYGEGLDGFLRSKSYYLMGIVNGIDYEEFNPQDDKLINREICRGYWGKSMHLELK